MPIEGTCTESLSGDGDSVKVERTVSPPRRSSKRSRSPCNPADELTCAICLDVVMDAYQSDCCGMLTCKKCTTALAKKSATCPHCREEGVVFFRDAFRERQAAALVLTCDKCGFSGKRDEYRHHVAIGHETPDQKITRLEKELMDTRAKLQTEKDQKTSAILARTDSTNKLLQSLITSRAGKNAIFHRKFEGAAGLITETVERDNIKFTLKIQWQHYNVCAWMSRVGGDEVAGTVRLFHQDPQKDRVLTVTPPGNQTRGAANWMTLREMEGFRHCDNFIVFSFGF